MTEITTIRGTLPSEIHRLHQEQSGDVYQKFNFESRRTQVLAIDNYREHVRFFLFNFLYSLQPLIVTL